MAVMPDQSCATLLKASVTGQSRSSSASTLRKASKSFPEDGSSSAPSHGSTAAGDWPKIGKNPSQVHRHGYSLHISEPSRVKLQGIVIMRRVLDQTLRCQRSLPSQTGAFAADPSRQRLRAGGQLVHRAGVWPPSGGRQISWPIISGPLFTRSKRRGIPLCATLRNS